jgi:plasmid maintenance system antidote protein VapI
MRELYFSDGKRHIRKEKQIFEFLMRVNNFKSDSQLANFLYCTPPIISRIRNGHMNLTPRMILTIYDKTTLTIEEIRKMGKEDAKIN